MRCIYFDKDNVCSGDRDIPYEPSEKDINDYCEGDNFKTCPRLHVFQRLLK